ncbi:MAG: ABC transporter ATP-binding protein [Gaiellaceae bacterium]
MLSSDHAIRVERLGKLYRIGAVADRPTTVREHLVHVAAASWRRVSRGGHGAANVDLWALRDVSFDVERGEVLGIIGRNGAGKSTLLKILSRITAQTEGTVTLYGKVGSLLEVGTGFHAELTGRENVFLNGALLGMRRAEIARKFEEIVEFSEIERFIDTPVKRYSSGMYVRLAFAVAAHLEPEILIVDEVLAVGDLAFQRKCLGKMDEVARSGRTVLFVSHNVGAVQALCERCLVLDEGELVFDGPTHRAVDKYVARSMPSGSGRFRLREARDVPVQVTAIEIQDNEGHPVDEVELGSDVTIVGQYRIDRRVRDVTVAALLSAGGAPLLYSYDVDLDETLREWRDPGAYQTRIALPTGLFKEGNYHVSTQVGWAGENLSDPDAFVSFEIVNRLRDTTHTSYRRDRPGHVFAELEWETVRIGPSDEIREPQLGSAAG